MVLAAIRSDVLGIPRWDQQPFDLHILLVDLNKRSATLGLIEPTRRLAELFRAWPGQQQRKVLGGVLCLEMDSGTCATETDQVIGCMWGA